MPLDQCIDHYGSLAIVLCFLALVSVLIKTKSAFILE